MTPSALSATLHHSAEEEGGQRALARSIGASARSVRDWISGRRKPSRDWVQAIARWLGKDTDFVIGLMRA